MAESDGELLPAIERGETWTEEHKHKCLVSSLARRAQGQRMAFFDAYEKKHGRVAASILNREVKAEYEGLKSREVDAATRG